jgi:hypothetical protein
MKNITIWYRDSCLEHHKNELQAIQSQPWKIVNSRILIEPKELVVSRYSCLPYFDEQYQDVILLGSHLINTYKQHKYVADIRNYYLDLETVTPKTWFNLDDIDEEGPFVLKGSTNSRKGSWKTKMFAKDLEQAKDIHWELLQDPLFQDSKQDIVIRKFVNFHKYFDGINGMPVTKEFRFFLYKENILANGFYWSNYADEFEEIPTVNEAGIKLVKEVAKIVSKNINFYVIDIGQLESGEWIVVELNDAMMAGLSCCDPFELYLNLYNVLKD